MRIRPVLLGACILMSLVGCSSGTHTVSKPTVGDIHGDFVGVGGPAPGRPVPIKGEVTLTEMTTKATFKVRSEANGKFSIAVPPGTYSAVGFTPAYRVNNRQGQCGSIGAASVEAGRTATLVVACQYK